MKRTNEAENQTETREADTAAYAETIRNIHDSSNQTKSKGEDEKFSLFWRVFGGTILSIVALVAITVFNGMNSSISELRADISRLNEAKAEAAKKDDVSALRTQVSLLAAHRAEIDSLKERAAKYRAELEETKKEMLTKLELAKKEHEIETDAMKKDLAAVDMLKERSAETMTELKAAKVELSKVRLDVDKNQAADHERRDQRTGQMKVVDETLKEIQKAMLESREKIARLEGQVQSKSVQPVRATESERQ